MKITKIAAGFAALALIAPAAASAQVYYYAPNTTSGAYNYSYIPQSAMPYVQLGYQTQQQSQQQYQSGYSYPYGYSYSYPSQYQSQYQYQTSYPSYGYGYQYPQNYGYSYGMNQYGEYAYEPQSVSYPSGTYGPFNTQLCYWSDYPTYAPCGNDPQQWVQDPYTGGWY